MTRFCAVYCVYDENYWLPYSFVSLYPAVSKIYFLVSEVPWYGEARDTGETLSCIAKLPDPENKIEVISGRWGSEVEQRNFSLAVASTNNYDYTFIIDADEIYHLPQLEAIKHLAISSPEVDCWHINWVTYWKSVHFRIDPIEAYQPVVLIKLGATGYVETRNPLGKKHELIPPEVGVCHHMSYALPDHRIARKHISFSGHSQSYYQGWYDNVWKAWDNNHELCDLHPNTPSIFKKAVPVPREVIPDTILKIYDNGGLP